MRTTSPSTQIVYRSAPAGSSMSASFCVPTRTRAPLPPSASIKRNELARPISTGMTAPGNSTRLRSDSSGSVLVFSVLIRDLYDAVQSRKVSKSSHGRLGGSRGNLFEQLTRLGVVRSDFRRHDLDAGYLVSPRAVRSLDAPPAQAQPGAARRARRDGQRDRTFDGRHLDLGAQHRFRDRHGQFQLDVLAGAAQMGIGAHVEIQVQVARRATRAGCGSAFAGNAQP